MSLVGGAEQREASSDVPSAANSADRRGRGRRGRQRCPPDNYSPRRGYRRRADGEAELLAVTGKSGCAENLGNNVKVNQNCLNVSDPISPGRGQAQNEDLDRDRPERTRTTWSPARTTTAAVTATATARTARRRQQLERHDGADVVHARHAVRRRAPVLAGRRRHLGRLGHARATRTSAARCSTAAAASRRTPTSRARSSSSARPATTARRGTSPAVRSSRTTTPPARRRAPGQAADDGRRPRRQPVPGPRST